MLGTLSRRLQSLDKPIDLILVGLGFMGYGFLRRVQFVPGMRVAVIITRDVERSVRQLRAGGLECAVTDEPSAIHANLRRNVLSVSSDYGLIASLPYEIVVEMTGEVAYGAQVALTAFDSGKRLVTMNAELQATVGSALRRYAETRGAQLTDSQGDQPGSLAVLMDEARSYGFRPLMAGNIKGYLDRSATPDRLRDWAARTGLSLKQSTSFTDGTKMALEMSLVANHFGLRVLQSGMRGPRAKRVEDVLTLFDWSELPAQGCVDYLLGETLPAGVFVVGTHEDPAQASYLRYLKMGDGPHYLLYRPFHLCHLEAPLSVARLALYEAVTINNSSRPTTCVVAVAKRDLYPGEVVDGIGGYCCYGRVENLDGPGVEAAVPIGLIENAVVTQPVERGQPVRWSDVALARNAATAIWATPEPLAQTFHVAAEDPGNGIVNKPL